MKKVFFTLMFVFLELNFAQAAEGIDKYRRECLDIISSPLVEVTSSYGKLKYNFEKDKDFLRQETMKKYAEKNLEMPEDYMPIGLTKVREALEVGVVIGQIDVSHGYTCFYPEKITAHLGYYVPTIYVLNELEKGTCLYDVTLRHEKTHMQIYIEALDYFLPSFKKTANGLFDKVGVMVVKKNKNHEAYEKVAKELNDAYSEVVKKEIEAWRKEVEAEQLKLDSPEHYMIENRVCQELDNK